MHNNLLHNYLKLGKLYFTKTIVNKSLLKNIENFFCYYVIM